MNVKHLLAIGFFSLSIAATSSAQTAPTGEVRAAFQKLMADTKSALADSTVTQAQFQQLKSDLWTAVDGATKPDPALVEALKKTVQDARSDGQITEREKAKIIAAVQKVLASANIPLSEAQAVKNDLLAIANAANVTSEEMAIIIADLQALFMALPTPPVKP